MQKTHELQWQHDFESTLSRAKAGGKHLLLDFSAAPM